MGTEGTIWTELDVKVGIDIETQLWNKQYYAKQYNLHNSITYGSVNNAADFYKYVVLVFLLLTLNK